MCQKCDEVSRFDRMDSTQKEEIMEIGKRARMAMISEKLDGKTSGALMRATGELISKDFHSLAATLQAKRAGSLNEALEVIHLLSEEERAMFERVGAMLDMGQKPVMPSSQEMAKFLGGPTIVPFGPRTTDVVQ